MLKSWRLAHFKSVHNKVELQLAPLTIFAGANSSGKSTIIQSMLLTAQTLQSPVLTRPVVLNGHIARLGAFTDIVFNAVEEDAVSIGFTLQFDRDQSRTLGRPSHARGLALFPFRRLPKNAEIHCDYSFSMRGEGSEKDLLRLQPRLEQSKVRVHAEQENELIDEEIVVRRSTVPIALRVEQLKLPEDVEATEQNPLSFEVDKLVGRLTGRGQPFLASRKNVGALLKHFTPSSVAVTYDTVETEVRQIVDTLTSPGSYSIYDLDEVTLDESVNDTIREIVLKGFNWLRENEDNTINRLRLNKQISELERDFSFTRLLRSYRALTPSRQGIVAQVLTERKEDLKRAIRAGRSSSFALRNLPLPETLGISVAAIQSYFSSSVKYLGPLRDEPKPVYPLAGVLGPNDIGFRGEHTAAVLDVNRNTHVENIPTTCFSTDTIDIASRREPLADAVLDWLDYMGVGTQLRTIDRGMLGHELKIATADSQVLHDLTQVGVGVSQVLPILVLSLLADRGSTLIFEQPELHLHPRVQTRLADFFVAMSKLGKQCILETHSEYLINRLRFRAATSTDKEISESVVLYFVEKWGGESHYREIRINEYGVIEDWPQGFFDESDTNAAATLKAGLAKRKRKNESRTS